MTTLTRLVALPLLSAGIIGGAIGFAGAASAEVTTTTTNGHSAVVATQHTTAKPAADMLSRHRHRHHRNDPWR